MSINGWKDKEDVVQYTMEYYSAIKKWNNAICSNIDGPRDYYTKWSKPDRERQLLCGNIYMWNQKKKKKDTNELIYEKEIDSQI